MNRYRVKVTEMHSDFLWVYAETTQEAESKAIQYSDCMFECVEDAVVVEFEE